MIKKLRKNKYLMLFISLLKISATTFGGGFVIVPLLKSKFVDEKHLIDENEMLDLMAIAQSTPGPIAVNASVMIGYKIGGIFGGLTALLASMLPPLVIISIISVFYTKFRDSLIIKTLMAGMLCGVTAVIFDVVIKMILKIGKKIVPYIIMVAAFVLACIFHVNVMIIIALAAVAGLITYKVKK